MLTAAVDKQRCALWRVSLSLYCTSRNVHCTACRDAALQSVKALNSQTLIWANAQNAPWSIFNVRQRPFDPRKPQSSPPKLIWANRRKVRGGNQIKSRRSEDFYNTWAKHLAVAYFQFFWPVLGFNFRMVSCWNKCFICLRCDLLGQWQWWWWWFVAPSSPKLQTALTQVLDELERN